MGWPGLALVFWLGSAWPQERCSYLLALVSADFRSCCLSPPCASLSSPVRWSLYSKVIRRNNLQPSRSDCFSERRCCSFCQPHGNTTIGGSPESRVKAGGPSSLSGSGSGGVRTGRVISGPASPQGGHPGVRSQLSCGGCFPILPTWGFDSLSVVSQILINTDFRICRELPCPLTFLNCSLAWQFMSLWLVEDGFLCSVQHFLAFGRLCCHSGKPGALSVWPVGVTLWKQARRARWGRNLLQTS